MFSQLEWDEAERELEHLLSLAELEYKVLG
jgi:hypothetical protein